MIKSIFSFAFASMLALGAVAENVITVTPVDGDATEAIRQAIDRVKEFKGKPVTVRFSPGNYNISRENASKHLYHISNTASESENPDQTKYIGVWLRDLRNVTVDGAGAWLVTHGEITPIVIDNCENVRFCNFTLTAADPSVPEMKVINVDRNSFTAEITAPSRYEIVDGDFAWIGEGWRFAEGARETFYPEFAQVFYPETNITLRVDSPLKGRKSARALSDNVVQFFFDNTPSVHPGEIYQMRHGIRNQACAFINRSRDVKFDNFEFNFLGNFGLVGQFSENITYDNIRCRPRLGSGRTDAGFADFVQMSGCRGKVRILNSYFEGAHDDPINIHGTHLKIVEQTAPDCITVRFMHGQTYGFEAFFKDDEVEIVDRHTLLPIQSCRLKDAVKVDDYTMRLTLSRPLAALPEGTTIDDFAVENVTWTPEVEIRGNYFSRIPTRGILITTRRKSVIEDNVFYRIPMPSILLSDDARGWYESGPVHDLTIRNNTFIECYSPVISINPEIDRYDGPVHQNVSITANRFIFPFPSTRFVWFSNPTPLAVKANAVSNLSITDNVFDLSLPSELNSSEPAGIKVAPVDISTLIETTDTPSLTIDRNTLIP